MNNFRFNAGRIDMLMSVRPEAGGRPMFPGAFSFTVVYASGKVLDEESMNMGMASAHFAAASAQGPFKLVCRMATEARPVQADAAIQERASAVSTRTVR